MRNYREWEDNPPLLREEREALESTALMIWLVMLVLAACVFIEPFADFVEAVLR